MPWTLIITLVLMIASYAIQSLTSSKQATAKAAAITDFQFPQSAEGQAQAVIFGDAWSPDHQILWFGNYRNSPIKSKSSKKGSSSSTSAA